MLISVIAVGVGVLVALAVAIGRIEGGAQEAAWRHVAAERRDIAEQHRLLDEHAEALAEKERELWAREEQLADAAASRGCPVCELRRGRGERPTG
jgi:Tfp pilus assembly protein PilV